MATTDDTNELLGLILEELKRLNVAADVLSQGLASRLDFDDVRELLKEFRIGQPPEEKPGSRPR